VQPGFDLGGRSFVPGELAIVLPSGDVREQAEGRELFRLLRTDPFEARAVGLDVQGDDRFLASSSLR